MKNIFLTIAICAILFSSCRNNSSKQTDTHIHDDGTEHINHDNSAEKMPKQELFEVEIDSLKKDSLNSEPKTEHTHEGGHKHKH